MRRVTRVTQKLSIRYVFLSESEQGLSECKQNWAINWVLPKNFTILIHTYRIASMDYQRHKWEFHQQVLKFLGYHNNWKSVVLSYQLHPHSVIVQIEQTRLCWDSSRLWLHMKFHWYTWLISLIHVANFIDTLSGHIVWHHI